MDIKLSKPVTRNSNVDENDVHQIKTALNRLGYYYPHEDMGITGMPDEEMFAAIKAFQDDQGLKPTGEIRPEDATLEALKDETSRQIEEGEYVWHTVGDDKVRPEHAAFNGEIRSWQNDSPLPGEDYGCRCWAVPVSDIEREELPEPEEDEEEDIPGTEIPDRGIPEQGYPGSPYYDPSKRNQGENAIPLLPFQPPNPGIDPRMEIPYNPENGPKYRDT